MLRGEPVTVLKRVTGYDDAMDEVVTWEEEARVDNVLFGKPDTEAIESGLRLHGVQVIYTLAIPKAYGGSLAGKRVVRESDGAEYDVVGDPAALPPSLCPTPWNRECDVRRGDG